MLAFATIPSNLHKYTESSPISICKHFLLSKIEWDYFPNRDLLPQRQFTSWMIRYEIKYREHNWSFYFHCHNQSLKRSFLKKTWRIKLSCALRSTEGFFFARRNQRYWSVREYFFSVWEMRLGRFSRIDMILMCCFYRVKMCEFVSRQWCAWRSSIARAVNETTSGVSLKFCKNHFLLCTSSEAFNGNCLMMMSYAMDGNLFLK